MRRRTRLPVSDRAMRRLCRIGLLVSLCWMSGADTHARGSIQAGQWRSTEILGGASPEDMDLFMRAINASLGVECALCHEGESWHLETRPEKEAARDMMRMVAELGETSFEVLDVPTCWTCHRGRTVPEAEPVGPSEATGPPGVFASTREPAGEIYDNLEQYAAIPAADLAGVMRSYSAALGVGCDYCHVSGDFASDEMVTKVLSRRMFEIQGEIQAEFFPTGPELTCWSCHQGDASPEINLPPGLMAIR